MRRSRNAKIIATLGPASSTPEMILALFETGVDVFRLNFSHGTREDHQARFEAIRWIESVTGRPIGILMDLQGPKLRIGSFKDGSVDLSFNREFRLDLDPAPGDPNRVCLPHPEIFTALVPGTDLLVDDGKMRLRVVDCGADFALTQVKVAGTISERKGVNLPNVVLPISPLTAKDRSDLSFGLELGVDWVALSFVQRPEDVLEARDLIGSRALIMSKLEKPAAIDNLDEIVALSDGIMIARGDLGVEVPLERVPILQRRILRVCRSQGKPVVVATQMLESMTSSPVPTRAEASDVAAAVFEGADAVMLSAESASGRYPCEAVRVMNSIIEGAEGEAHAGLYNEIKRDKPRQSHADAICSALGVTAHLIEAKATVAYTKSGSSTIRAARERPPAPILSLTPSISTARQLAPVWGVHSLVVNEIEDEASMTQLACNATLGAGFGKAGDNIVIIAGIPFGVSGTTNLLRTATLPEPSDGSDNRRS
ncbi:pyruvate kinase [Streptomyces sp. AcH 505]|uniref:pyruvate kinase n=1 Tax=Streptomyces sp. AcH 505 TaxID=352211 RepID=UPI00099C286B